MLHGYLKKNIYFFDSVELEIYLVSSVLSILLIKFFVALFIFSFLDLSWDKNCESFRVCIFFLFGTYRENIPEQEVRRP